jgi:hypothetical protein
MYSAVFFGWPTTSIRPSRLTSTPTWSIDVARTTSKGLVARLGAACPPCGARGIPRLPVESKSGRTDRHLVQGRGDVGAGYP